MDPAGRADADPPAPAARITAARITAALIPQSAAALNATRERTGLSKTDIVNRALTFYEFADSHLRDGRDLLVRDRETGETQLIRFL